MKNKKLIILMLLFLSVVLLPITYSKYTKTVSDTINLSVAQPTYTVVFHSNTNPDTITSQNFTYGTAQQLNANTFTNGNKVFLSWNTAADGSGTEFQNGAQVNNLTSVNNDIIDLYAQWKCNSNAHDENGVCELNSQTVSCDPSGIPTNAYAVIDTYTKVWDNGWSSEPAWSLNGA